MAKTICPEYDAKIEFWIEVKRLSDELLKARKDMQVLVDGKGREINKEMRLTMHAKDLLNNVSAKSPSTTPGSHNTDDLNNTLYAEIEHIKNI